MHIFLQHKLQMMWNECCVLLVTHGSDILRIRIVNYFIVHVIFLNSWSHIIVRKTKWKKKSIYMLLKYSLYDQILRLATSVRIRVHSLYFNLLRLNVDCWSEFAAVLRLTTRSIRISMHVVFLYMQDMMKLLRWVHFCSWEKPYCQWNTAFDTALTDAATYKHCHSAELICLEGVLRLCFRRR